MAEPYKHVYRHVDPKHLPPSDGSPYAGTNAECLRDGLLDVVHIALDTGMTMDDVDAALAQVVEHVAGLHRERFKVHAKAKTPP